MIGLLRRCGFAFGVLAIGLAVAPGASAFSFEIAARNATSHLTVGDTVTVDVFLDAQPGINFFSVSVLGNASVLSYDPAASAALPIVHPAPAPAYGTTGAQPGYILYSPAGTGHVGPPAVYMLPLETPAWLTWSTPPPGVLQVNIDWAEGNIADTLYTRATGTHLWIAGLVFRVDAPFAVESLSLSLTSGGNIFQTSVPLDPSTVGLSAPIVLVPEPATALLIGLGVLGVLAWGRRS